MSITCKDCGFADSSPVFECVGSKVGPYVTNDYGVPDIQPLPAFWFCPRCERKHNTDGSLWISDKPRDLSALSDDLLRAEMMHLKWALNGGYLASPADETKRSERLFAELAAIRDERRRRAGHNLGH